MTGPTLRILAAATLAVQPFTVAEAGHYPDPPQVPTELEAPEGSRLFLTLHAVGTQNQMCVLNANGVGSWNFFGPQATLFNNKGEQVGTHFLSTNMVQPGSQSHATWQHSRDTSTVWAVAVGTSIDPEYVDANAIAWLLLEVKGTQDGPGGGDRLSGTTYIQRINTAVLTPVSTATLQPFNPFTTTPVQGVNWNLGPNFGRAVNRFAYTTPQSMRLSFGVRF